MRSSSRTSSEPIARAAAAGLGASLRCGSLFGLPNGSVNSGAYTLPPVLHGRDGTRWLRQASRRFGATDRVERDPLIAACAASSGSPARIPVGYARASPRTRESSRTSPDPRRRLFPEAIVGDEADARQKSEGRDTRRAVNFRDWRRTVDRHSARICSRRCCDTHAECQRRRCCSDKHYWPPRLHWSHLLPKHKLIVSPPAVVRLSARWLTTSAHAPRTGSRGEGTSKPSEMPVRGGRQRAALRISSAAADGPPVT